MDMVKEKMEVTEVTPEAQEEFMKVGREASKVEIVKQVGEEYYNYFMGELAKSEKELLGAAK